jgi:hypothetical protein
MTIVLRPGDSVDDLVVPGKGSCPACGGVLRKWGYARSRVVREGTGESYVRPGRVRCADCGVTQVVLPAHVLVRRRDAVAVIGRAWSSFAAGAGARRVARQLALPMETVRGWLRRLRGRARRMSQQDRVGDGLYPLNARNDLTWALAQVVLVAETTKQYNDPLWSFISYQYQGRLLSNTS